MGKRFCYLFNLLISLSVFVAVSTPASAEEFFKGKTIRIIVGYSPGGGYDTYARAAARHMGKYIPGNPTFIVQNMTGAGSLIAANYTARNAMVAIKVHHLSGGFSAPPGRQKLRPGGRFQRHRVTGLWPGTRPRRSSLQACSRYTGNCSDRAPKFANRAKAGHAGHMTLQPCPVFLYWFVYPL